MTSMHHRTVTRVAISVWALVGLTAAIFGWNAARPNAPVPAAGQGDGPQDIVDAGRVAFRAHCSACHRCEELVVDPKRAARLLERLDSHGRAELVDDLAIVAFLATPGACATSRR